MKIYLNFIGTCVDSTLTTRTNFGCCEVILCLQEAGHEVIWNTESEKSIVDKWLEYSWMFFAGRDKQERQLQPIKWSGCKNYAGKFDLELSKEEGILYLDDFSDGIPLKHNFNLDGYNVDFYALDDLLKKHGFYEKINQ